jgi:3-oxoacyl-[acyl-carrier protein] reductase
MSKNQGKLSGKVAVVTGASKGIGAAIARALAGEGAAVVVNYASSRSGADKVVADVENAGGTALAIQADLSQPADIVRLFTETKKRLGRVDVLVNNAGVYEFLPLAEVTPEHFHRQFNINVLGLILATQEAVKYFGETGGSVINVGSLAGQAGLPDASVYSGTKGAVDAVTRSLAAELGPRHIRVNALNPGMVETEGTAAIGITDADSQLRKQVEAQTPLGRIGRPDDMGPVAVFLASDDSRWVTGETLYISGGYR